MKLKYAFGIIAILFVGIIFLSGCSEKTPEIQQNNTTQPATVEEPLTAAISIQDTAFVPQELEIKVGTTVTWTNNDDESHRVAGRGFRSDDMLTGDTYSYTFTEAGEYNYICEIHPSMTGKIIVG